VSPAFFNDEANAQFVRLTTLLWFSRQAIFDWVKTACFELFKQLKPVVKLDVRSAGLFRLFVFVVALYGLKRLSSTRRQRPQTVR
jgi:hypothetical protein